MPTMSRFINSCPVRLEADFAGFRRELQVRVPDRHPSEGIILRYAFRDFPLRSDVACFGVVIT